MGTSADSRTYVNSASLDAADHYPRSRRPDAIESLQANIDAAFAGLQIAILQKLAAESPSMLIALSAGEETIANELRERKFVYRTEIIGFDKYVWQITEEGRAFLEGGAP